MLTHFDQFGERGAQRFLHRRPGIFRLDRLFRHSHHARSLEDRPDGNFTGRIQLLLQSAHRFVIRLRESSIEREFAHPVWAIVITDEHVCSAARNAFVDRLTNARLEFVQIARQIHHDVALLPVYGIKLHAELRAVVIGLTTAVTGHASHKKVMSGRTFNVQRSTLNVQRSIASGEKIGDGAMMGRRNRNGINRVDVDPALLLFVDLARRLGENLQRDLVMRERKDRQVYRGAGSRPCFERWQNPQAAPASV